MFFQLTCVVLFILFLLLLLRLPKAPLIAASFGALLGAVAGSGVGIASGGGAMAGTILPALGGFVIGGLLGLVGLLTQRFGIAPDAPAISGALARLRALWSDSRRDQPPPSRPPRPAELVEIQQGRVDVWRQHAISRTYEARAAEKRSSSGILDRIVFTILVVIALVVVVQYLTERPHRDGAGWYSTGKPPSTETPSASEETSYQSLLADLESKHPEIDRNSPKHDPEVAGRVLTKRDALIAQGIPLDDALRQAVAWAFRAAPPRSSVARDDLDAERLPEGTRECVFKGVMSDADYRACGITPP